MINEIKLYIKSISFFRRRCAVKHSSVGRWVDGPCGYMFSNGYHKTKREAIKNALRKIKKVFEATK
jgi:hypothetical protein